MGVDAPDEAPRLGIAGALGWGFLTAIATGPFAILLIIAVMIAADPTELINDPLAILTGLASLLTFGSFFAIIFAIIIGWLPISLFGWLTRKAAERWPVMQRRTAWAGVGAVTGGLCIALVGGGIEDLINEPDRANWERLRDFLLFGGGCGIFSALFFRRLVERAQRQGDTPDPLVTEHLP